MLKNNDIIQTELEDNNIKRLYDFVLKKESLRNDILQQICKNIFEKEFYFTNIFLDIWHKKTMKNY